MKFCLPQIRIQNSSGIVAGTIIKIPILPKLALMKHGHWNLPVLGVYRTPSLDNENHRFKLN
jgi:hypothetical protein